MNEVTEHTILLNMKSCANDLFKLVNMICEIKTKREKIQNDIDNLNNNYFVKNSEIYSKYLDHFSDKHNEETTNAIKNETFNTHNGVRKDIFLFIKDIDCAISNLCEHEWIHDNIDIGPESSENIIYCSKCELTRK